MSYVIFIHVKDTDSISYVRSVHLYDSLDTNVERKEFRHDIFEELLIMYIRHPLFRKGKSLQFLKKSPHLMHTEETTALVEQNDTINACRFLILFVIHLVTLFSLEQNNFFLEHKLSPVHLTWLHLVYGKILF